MRRWRPSGPFRLRVGRLRRRPCPPRDHDYFGRHLARPSCTRGFVHARPRPVLDICRSPAEDTEGIPGHLPVQPIALPPALLPDTSRPPVPFGRRARPGISASGRDEERDRERRAHRLPDLVLQMSAMHITREMVEIATGRERAAPMPQELSTMANRHRHDRRVIQSPTGRDIEFPRGRLPASSRGRIHAKAGTADCEVQQHLGKRVRAVAMTTPTASPSACGLDTARPPSRSVTHVGRGFDVLGHPIDGKGDVRPRPLPIHRAAPVRRSSTGSSLETG